MPKAHHSDASKQMILVSRLGLVHRRDNTKCDPVQKMVTSMPVTIAEAEGWQLSPCANCWPHGLPGY